MWLALGLALLTGAHTLTPAVPAAIAADVPAAAGMPAAATADVPAAADAPAADFAWQEPLLAISYDPGAGYRPLVRVGPVLREQQIEQAARSGLPVRVRVRIELWRDRLFDQLVDSASWSTVIAYEPIGDQFFVRAGGTSNARRFDSFTRARSAVETDYAPQIRPRTPGRYYYTTTLQIETLSVSDLEELERWLQGELQPAVSGQRSVPGALGQGAKRLMLRLLDLPQRRIDARTDRFSFPPGQ
jgi:hypothetical protein